MTVTFEDIRTFYKGDTYTLEELEDFLQKREAFLENESPENLLAMQNAFIDIYEEVKLSLSARHLTEEQFFAFKDRLQDLDRD